MTTTQHHGTRKRLTKLRIEEVSIVDTPANPGASILIAKRHGDDPAPDESQPITKAAAEGALDDLAAAIAKRDGVSYAQAYMHALREQPDLYEAYLGGPVTKRRGDTEERARQRKEAERALEDRAKARRLKTGESFALAFVEVLRSPEGQKLYAQAIG